MGSRTADLTYLLVGLGVLLAAALPRWAAGRAFSPPLVFIGLGAAVGLLLPGAPAVTVPAGAPGTPTVGLETEAVRAVVEHATELVVVVALFGVGLALDRPFGWRSWRSTWRLLAVVMPVSIGVVALLGWWLAGLALPAAVLLAAALAPTDPVLASEVQVGAPATEPAGATAEDEVRFGLTSEAGLNDGLAFPFVYAAILLAAGAGLDRLGGWVVWELVGKCLLGVCVGAAAGFLISRLAFGGDRLGVRFAESADAVVALAAIGVAYGAAELVGGYGFLAVFVAALVLRSRERTHEYHRVLHGFVQEIEQVLTLAVLVGLGFGCVRGLLSGLTIGGAVVAVTLVLVVRPVVAWASLAGLGLAGRQRGALAFFGVRGVGTVYYLAYASGQAAFPDLEAVWATAVLAIVVSALVHGTLAGPTMSALDARRSRRVMTEQQSGHRSPPSG